VDVDAVVRNRDRPEKPARCDPRVEIVQLGRQTDVLVQIESGEGERAVVHPAVSADELAPHEAVVDVEEHVLGGPVRQRRRQPTPVPGNPALGGLHIYLPAENSEPSAITDLNGFVGIGAVKGAGETRCPGRL
jgi:hypothetical protein